MELKKRTTIAEVARAANVAASTVSRVMNGGYASASARARVEAAIAELDYVPAGSRSLRNGPAGVLGVVLGDISLARSGAFLDALAAHAAPQLLVSLSANRGGTHAAILRRWTRYARVDGIIWVHPYDDLADAIGDAESRGLPSVAVEPIGGVAAEDVVCVSSVESGRALGYHLAKLGHRTTTFVCRAPDADWGRVQGMREGLGGAVEERLLSGTDAEIGRRQAAGWIERAIDNRPTAVVFANDSMAEAFIRSVTESGLRVPTDVSVVGCGASSDLEQDPTPPLTTLVHPTVSMARDVAALVRDRVEAKIHGHEVDPHPTRMVYEYAAEVRERGTTGPVHCRN